MISIIILATIAGFFLWKILIKTYHYNHRRSLIKKQKIKGPEDTFLIGNALQIETDSVLFCKQLSNYSLQYKDEEMFVLWMGVEPYIFCHKPESVEKLLSSTSLIKKAGFYDFMRPWVGDGLVLSQGKKYQARRKCLNPTFHFKILQDFLPVFNKQTKILLDLIQSKSKEDQSVDIYSLLARATLDIIAETAMGVEINAQLNNDSEYAKAVFYILDLISKRFKNPFYASDTIYYWSQQGRKFSECIRFVHRFVDNVIEERKKQRKRKSQVKESLKEDEDFFKTKPQLAFLDLLLEHQEQEKSTKDAFKITNADIRDEVNTFMAAGSETTSTATTMASYLLAKYPEEQKKVQDELDDIFGEDKDRDITNNDIQKMNYLDLVIKESLRLFSPVHFIGRKVEQDTEFCGYTIPEGTSLLVFLQGLHVRDDLYSDPKAFKPERFKLENISSNERNAYSFVPFSAGPRNCIGAKFFYMEEKVLLASIFRKYKLTTHQLEEDLGLASQFAQKPNNPVNIMFTLR